MLQAMRSLDYFNHQLPVTYSGWFISVTIFTHTGWMYFSTLDGLLCIQIASSISDRLFYFQCLICYSNSIAMSNLGNQ